MHKPVFGYNIEKFINQSNAQEMSLVDSHSSDGISGIVRIKLSQTV